jgi:hypothetical protein
MCRKHDVNWILISCGVLLLALGGSGSPSPLAAQDGIQVASADPSVAEQGTVNLDVVIGGRGFDQSAHAQFFVTGSTNPGGITVNSTAFRGPKKLVANIDVSQDAVLDKFDIEVQLSGGRTGKGTELFTVVQPGHGQGSGLLASATEFLDPAGGVRDDGLGPYVDYFLTGEPSDCTRSWVGEITGNVWLRPYSAAFPPSPECPLPELFDDGTCEDVEDYRQRLIDQLGEIRLVVIDFNDPVLDVGQSMEELCSQVPGGFCDAGQYFVRLRADDVFAPDAQYTPLLIQIDEPKVNGPWHNPTECALFEFWEIRYEQTLQVSQVPGEPDSRVVSTSTVPGGDVAQLVKVIWKKNRKYESIGRFRLPTRFKLTNSNQEIPGYP